MIVDLATGRQICPGGLMYSIMNIGNNIDLNYSNHKKEMVSIRHNRGAKYSYNGNHITVDKCFKPTICHTP